MRHLLPLSFSLLIAAAIPSQAATVVSAKIWTTLEGQNPPGPAYADITKNVQHEPSDIDGWVITESGWIGWGGGSITIALDELETVTSVTMTGARLEYPDPVDYVPMPQVYTIPLYSGHASDTGAGTVYFDFANAGPNGERNIWIWQFPQQFHPWEQTFSLTFTYTIETTQGTYLYDNGGNGWTMYSMVPEPSVAACSGLAVLLAVSRRRRSPR